MPNGPSSSLTHRNEFDNLGPQTNTQVRDDSSSRQPFSVSNMIKPTQPYLPTANQPNYGQSTNGQGTSGQSSTYGTGQSYGTGNLHGTTATGTNTSNQGYNPNTQNPTTYNANGNLQPYSAAQSNSPSTYPNQIGSQIPLLAQNYGAQTTQPPAYGTSGYPIIPNPNLNPNTSFAGTPIATNLPNQNGQTGPAKVSDEHNPTQESFLPFLLLFSIVGNVYLGLWMHHLRKRYRELRSSLRGIPISELA